MNKANSLKIVFMGTPGFAVHILSRLVEEGYRILAAVTAEDKQSGRGLKISFSPVKEYALRQGLKVLQPANLKSDGFLNELEELNADLFIVVAFRMLPEVVWSMPRMGTINLHASLLPQYRGAAPINHAIINGETETGVTTFFIEKEIDTGKILLQKKLSILPEDNAGSLHDKLMALGADLMLETIRQLAEGNLHAIDQQSIPHRAELKPAPKILKSFCSINWNQEATEIACFVRGLSPYPGAYAILKENEDEILFKIFEATAVQEKHEYRAGTIVIGVDKKFLIATSDGYLQIDDLQLAGKKRMTAHNFMLGFKDFQRFSIKLDPQKV